MAKYKAGKGAGYSNEQAQALGLVLESIGFSASPLQIVAAARPKSSPIHKLFEWDDTIAAERFRLSQARNHVNHLEVVIIQEKGERSTKAFHSVIINSGDQKHRAYCHMENVAENEDLK